jgi:preprotein translocase subunit YajC
VTHVLYATFLQAASNPLGLPVLLFQILAIGVVFYFLIIRPQSTARKKHAELLGALKKGDDVMTAGGIVGIVKDIREKDGETRVTVESGSSTIVVERSRIVRVGGITAQGTPNA